MTVDDAQIQACLPSHLQGPETTLVRVRAGLSGAGVYRVQAAGQSFVLKMSAKSSVSRGAPHVRYEPS